MSDLRTAAQQALETLEQGFGMLRREAERKHEAAITALKAALEQPEQDTDCHLQGICQRSGYGIGRPEQAEPVAWLRREELADLQTCNYRQLGADSPRIWAPREADTPPPGQDLVPVFTHPPRREWRSLSEGSLMGIYTDFDRKADKQWTNAEYLLRLMDTVQAKLKEKNHE